MNRRDFLKGLLAGAAIAAVPSMSIGETSIPSITRGDLCDGKFHHIKFDVINDVVRCWVDNIQVSPSSDIVDAYVGFDDKNSKAIVQINRGVLKNRDNYEISFDVLDNEITGENNHFDGYIDKLVLFDHNTNEMSTWDLIEENQ